ncbi:MAG: M14 family zinc carboxypeptidase, partial [Bacteroidota bacterium]
MKKLCTTIAICLLCTSVALIAQVVEQQPTYKQVKLKTTPTLLADLLALGLPADHFHKTEDNAVELVFSEPELAVLDEAGIAYEVQIPDMRAHYLASLTTAPIESNQNCGLVNFDDGEMGGYHSYDDAVGHMIQMKTQYSDLVDLRELGTSIEGRTIWGVKISDNPLQDESATEGVVYFDALHHAREPMSLEASLYYMWWLLENYSSDAEANYLVNHRELYFIPVVNPDGYVYNQTTDPFGGGFWRKNRRGFGGCVGVDLNRNYGFGWGLNSGSSNDPCTDIYRGETPFSEPETQVVRDLLAEIQPAIAFTIHTFGDVFLGPFGYTDSLATYDLYAEFASEFIPQTYRGYGTTAKMLGYTSSGTTRDYLHSEGTFAWTPEIGHTFWEAPSVICDRVQEFLPTMKFLSWVSGDYACFHDFRLNDPTPIWNGETLSLNVRIKNRGLAQAAQNVEVTVNSLHSAVVATTSTVNYGAIAPRTFAENTTDPFLFEVTGILEPGEAIPMEVIVLQNGEEAYRDQFNLYAGEADVLFMDDGEQGMANWTSSGLQTWDTTFMDATSGGHAFADSRYGNYLPEEEATIVTSVPIDLSNTTNPWLEFNAKWSLENGSDFVYLQVSISNGGNWFFLQEYNQNQHWQQERIDLSVFADQSNLLFRFLIFSDDFLHSDGFYFDDFRVVDYQEPDAVPINELEQAPFDAKVFPNPGQAPIQIALTM